MAKMTIDGYGQVELNNVAFRRDGRIEAQCALSTVDFASAPAENGMILRVKKNKRELCFADASAANQLYVLLYSSEHMYDERKPGLKNFKTEATDDFYPRGGYLDKGDLWTTNLIDLGSYASYDAVKADLTSAEVYGSVGTTGLVTLASSAPSVGPVIQVIKATTMPDGQKAFQLQVLSI